MCDRHQRVAKLMHLGTAEVEERNLNRLVGCHEAFLNSLKHAHDVGSCHDFIHYFRLPCADALYSHHFEEFVEMMTGESGLHPAGAVSPRTPELARNPKPAAAPLSRKSLLLIGFTII